MKKLPVSVCLISGAEAHRIGDCLAGVKEWTSEIIVVLNEEVADGTEALVRSHGGTVIREPWKGHVRQKTSASDKAGQPWILSLDADERVSEALRDEIIALFEGSGNQPACEAYRFPRCTFYCGRWIRHGDWYPDRVTRLWRKGAARWAGEDPHDRIEVNGRTGLLKSDLLHHSNESIDRQLAKIGPYANYYVERQMAAGKNPGPLDFAVRPLWRFVRAYFFRLGFMDGWQGYYIASLSAFSTLTRQIKIREARWRATLPHA